MIKIDGNQIGGGGQILRISLALSAIQRKPVHVVNIFGDQGRAMKPQHVNGVKLMKQITQAMVQGDVLGSTEVVFEPQGLFNGKYVADPKTAGSVSLLLQVTLPCLLFCDHRSVLTLKGGTNVQMSPQMDYILNVFKPVFEKFGATFTCNIIRRGFFPAGQGHVEVIVPNAVQQLKPIILVDFGEVESITGEAFVSGVLPMKMAEEMARAAENELRQVVVNAKISVKPRKFTKNEAFGNGSGINLVAVTTTNCYLGGSHLGERGRTNAEIGIKAAEELLESIKRKDCVDPYTQDQIIIFMALANGKSRVKTGPITEHTERAIKVTELFTSAKFNVVKVNDETNIIECEGHGIT